MLFSGIVVKAQRNARWADVDITELSSEEFLSFWNSIEKEEERFYVADTLRRLSSQACDMPTEEMP